MNGAPLTKPETYDRIWTIIKAVDERGRQIDERWGNGRLPTLVPIDMAERFQSQSVKFNQAVWRQDLDEARKHGEAMIRAYDKLDQVATDAGADTKPVEQWEFETPDGLVVLVRDRNRMNQAQTLGRRCQVWSVDEIAEVIRNYPTIIAVKASFPGAELVETRPARSAGQNLNDSLSGLPF